MDTFLMAPRRNIDRSKVPAAMLEKAREAALAKQARIMAEQELGIGDSDLPVQKGPLPIENEPMVQVTIDLAPFVDRIVLDSVHYMQGRVYELSQRQAQTVSEIIARTWQHQAEIEGKDAEFYLKNRVAKTAVNVNNSAPNRLQRVSA